MNFHEINEEDPWIEVIHRQSNIGTTLCCLDYEQIMAELESQRQLVKENTENSLCKYTQFLCWIATSNDMRSYMNKRAGHTVFPLFLPPEHHYKMCPTCREMFQTHPFYYS